MRSLKSNLLCLLLFLVCSASLFGQLQQGDRLITFNSPNYPSSFFVNGAVSNDFGGVASGGDFDGVVLYGLLNYNFMLTGRFMLGGSLAPLIASETTAVGLGLNARYYVLNREQGMLFGEVQGATAIGDELEEVNTQFQFGVGYSLPLAPNALITPMLSYQIVDRNNDQVVLGAQLEIILGKNNRLDEKGQAAFGKGSFMLGANLGNISFNRGHQISISPEVHYFLANQFALGFGVSYVATKSNGDFEFSASTTTLDLGLRAYLMNYQRFTLFADAGAFYSNSFFEVNGQTFDEDDAIFGLDLGVGGNLWLRDNIALESGLSLRNTFAEESGFVLALNVGARVVLNRKY